MNPQQPAHTRNVGQTPMSDRVVIGFDGSQSAWNALRWAADEAGRRRGTLEVVACSAGPDADPATGSTSDDVDRAAWIARCRGCQIQVVGHPATGPIGEVLVEHSRGAAMLVLGAHEARRATGHGPSLGDYCRTNPACPVVVVTSATRPVHAIVGPDIAYAR